MVGTPLALHPLCMRGLWLCSVPGGWQGRSPGRALRRQPAPICRGAGPPALAARAICEGRAGGRLQPPPGSAGRGQWAGGSTAASPRPDGCHRIPDGGRGGDGSSPSQLPPGICCRGACEDISEPFSGDTGLPGWAGRLQRPLPAASGCPLVQRRRGGSRVGLRGRLESGLPCTGLVAEHGDVPSPPAQGCPKGSSQRTLGSLLAERCLCPPAHAGGSHHPLLPPCSAPGAS